MELSEIVISPNLDSYNDLKSTNNIDLVENTYFNDKVENELEIIPEYEFIYKSSETSTSALDKIEEEKDNISNKDILLQILQNVSEIKYTLNKLLEDNKEITKNSFSKSQEDYDGIYLSSKNSFKIIKDKKHKRSKSFSIPL